MTSKHYSLKTRLRLFNGPITPTVLYACTSWTLTNDLATTLLRTQRRMLRLMIGTPRRRTQPPQQDDNLNHVSKSSSSASNDDIESNPSTTLDLSQLVHDSQEDNLEPWVTYIQRATRIAEATMTRHSVTDWTTTYYQRKWRWGQRIANLPTDRW